MLTPCRRVLEEMCPFYYPFGNTSVRNVLEDCQLVGDNINVLFLGSGDLRNALKTAGNRKNIANLDIHLNDSNPSVVARNILILKIISADGFDIQNEEDISFLWDLWYNAEWPESTRKRFESVLKELLDNNLPDNVVIPKSSYLRTLKTVWSTWISIISKIESALFMKKIQKERKTVMFNGWYRLNKIEVDPNESPESLFPTIVNGYASFLALTFKGSLFRQKIEEEARSYYSTGFCRLTNGMGNVCVNPTMLDPTTYRWQVHYQLSPFDGYLPLTKEEFDTSDDEGILIRTCQKILKNLVVDFKKRIDGVKICIHLEDAVEFCLSESTLVFDLIDCSNLADHIGLVHLINGCEKILADTPGAMLFTETITWKSLAPSGLEYVEETLCCPLSLIPTIYGLQLLSHVELGSSKPTNNCFGKIPPIMLFWKKAPTFQNVTLNPSPDLNRCLDKLAQRCFLPQNLQNCKVSMKSTTPTAGARYFLVQLLSLTPFTFSYVVNSMNARVGGGNPLFRTDDVELPTVYNLSRRTLEAWKNNEILLKFSAAMQTNLWNRVPTGPRGFQHTAAMRLVIAPPDKFVKNYFDAICREQNQESVCEDDFSDPEIHVIDNFQLKVLQNAEGEIKIAGIFFLLVPDHGLKETHCAYVFDVTNPLLPILRFESGMHVEKYHQPYPFPPKRTQPPVTKSSFMRVDSCIESIDKYTLKIAIECRKDISDLTVSPNPTLPCESVHGLTLSLRQPNDIEPLALNFPFPILVNNISATLHSNTRSIDLVLKKALNEPWPCEFQATTQSRWNADNLKPWKDGSAVESKLKIHLGFQFKINEICSQLSQIEQKRSALKQVRGAIHSLMLSTEEFVCIRRKDSPQSPDWYIRVHLPVRVSPLDSPILLLSAIDHRLIKKLNLQGKVDLQQSSDDFTRIFEAPRYKKNPDGNMSKIWTFNSEGEQLLRFVLRLNSTKILPSAWQKKNLPQGENSSWLATFVSPLYDECPMDEESLNAIQEVQTSCGACNKISENLKRCSRCRSILYCSVECQRGHWTQHKNVCKNSQN